MMKTMTVYATVGTATEMKTSHLNNFAFDRQGGFLS